MTDEKKKSEIGGVPVCEPGGHIWVAIPSAHPSVTGQTYECSKCKHTSSEGFRWMPPPP